MKLLKQPSVFFSRRATSLLWRGNRGTTSVEFALLGSAFFMMIMLIFTIALDMFAQVLLDDAVRNAVRQVQMGKITSGSAFVADVCAEYSLATPGCTATLQYDVQGATAFAGITPATLSASGTLSTGANFSGVSASVQGAPMFILAQVAYVVPFEFINVANAVVTENGTPALYSAAAIGEEF